MDGKYLASNIGQLKTIGDGKALNAINDMLNSDRYKDVQLVGYSINGSEGRIVTVDCLFQHKKRETIYFRSFDFYKSTKKVEDNLQLSAKHGRGFSDHDLTCFIELRDFYLKNKEPIA